MIQSITLTPDELKGIIQQSISSALENLKPGTDHKEAQPEAEFLTRKETAKRLKISLTTLNDWSKRGIVIAYRIGTRIRYKSNEIDATLIQLKKV